jgi:hypothetical protein
MNAVIAPQTLPPAPAVKEDDLVKLAREVVMNIHDLPVILGRWGLTQSQFDIHIKPNPFFQRVSDQFRIEWESAGSTKARMQIKAQVALEESMSTLAARMKDTDEDLGKATETAKLFARIAGVEADKTAGPGEKVTIEINLGADTIKFEKEPVRTGPLIDATATGGTTEEVA